MGGNGCVCSEPDTCSEPLIIIITINNNSVARRQQSQVLWPWVLLPGASRQLPPCFGDHAGFGRVGGGGGEGPEEDLGGGGDAEENQDLYFGKEPVCLAPWHLVTQQPRNPGEPAGPIPCRWAAELALRAMEGSGEQLALVRCLLWKASPCCPRRAGRDGVGSATGKALQKIQKKRKAPDM